MAWGEEYPDALDIESWIKLEMAEGMDILLSGKEEGDAKRMRCVENYDVWFVFVLILNDRL
jgi:hypothetical protein